MVSYKVIGIFVVVATLSLLIEPTSATNRRHPKIKSDNDYEKRMQKGCETIVKKCKDHPKYDKNERHLEKFKKMNKYPKTIAELIPFTIEFSLVIFKWIEVNLRLPIYTLLSKLLVVLIKTSVCVIGPKGAKDKCKNACNQKYLDVNIDISISLGISGIIKKNRVDQCQDQWQDILKENTNGKGIDYYSGPDRELVLRIQALVLLLTGKLTKDDLVKVYVQITAIIAIITTRDNKEEGTLFVGTFIEIVMKILVDNDYRDMKPEEEDLVAKCIDIGSNDGGNGTPSGGNNGDNQPPSGGNNGDNQPPSGGNNGDNQPPSGGNNGDNQPPSGGNNGDNQPPSGGNNGDNQPPSGGNNGDNQPPSGGNNGDNQPPSGGNNGDNQPPSGGNNGNPSGSNNKKHKKDRGVKRGVGKHGMLKALKNMCGGLAKKNKVKKEKAEKVTSIQEPPTKFNGVINLIINLAEALTSVINQTIIKGLGDIIFKVIIVILKIVVCVLGPGNCDVCTRQYPGIGGPVHGKPVDIIKQTGLDKVLDDFNRIINQESKGKGLSYWGESPQGKLLQICLDIIVIIGNGDIKIDVITQVVLKMSAVSGIIGNTMYGEDSNDDGGVVAGGLIDNWNEVCEEQGLKPVQESQVAEVSLVINVQWNIINVSTAPWCCSCAE
ncbi:hypothetical protein O0L34_g16085 [Tuta absoluta]|nr:hypothetical protein O0L34_g16085 [Tuta absoluta]